MMSRFLSAHLPSTFREREPTRSLALQSSRELCKLGHCLRTQNRLAVFLEDRATRQPRQPGIRCNFELLPRSLLPRDGLLMVWRAPMAPTEGMEQSEAWEDPVPM